MKSLDGGGSSKRYKEISDRASMATSNNFLLQNLNEVSMIPKHIKMLIMNDAEALVIIPKRPNLFISHVVVSALKM